MINRVWDEAEAFYSEEEDGPKRDFCRQFGVVYVTKGPPAILSGLVHDGQGNPLEGAELEIVESGGQAVANIESRYDLSSRIIGTVHIRASYPGKTPVTIEVVIPEHEEEITIQVPTIVL